MAELAGLKLDDWQKLSLIDGMGEKATGKWAAFEVADEVPRQSGKGTILEARELTGLFVIEQERLLIHSAHEQITSSEHFRRILNLIEGVPEFDRRVQKVVRGKGSEAIELRDGTRILFKTRTSGGGRGLTGDFVALDEAMILALAVVGVLIPTMAARSIVGNPQVWYAGSSVDKDKHEHGIAFARVRQRALNGALSLAYFGWCADVRAWREARGLGWDEERSELEQVTPEMLDDREMWAQANPGLGIRISVDHVALERSALGAREFAVERLGIADPPDTSEDSGRVISQEAWSEVKCQDETKRIVGERTYAVDVAPSERFATVAVAGVRDDGLFHIAVVEHGQGTGWVKATVRDLLANGGRVVGDRGGPADAVISDLIDDGLMSAEDLTSSVQYAQACAQFLNAVLEKRVRYPFPQPELDAALGSARATPLENSWKWSRKTSTAPDISPLIAVTLALWGARNLESFATVLYGSDEQPAGEDPEIGPAWRQIGPKPPRVISPEEYTTCFACAQGGRCPVHSM